ncbi:MAG: cytidine deaminase [Anaerolineae bacterium]
MRKPTNTTPTETVVDREALVEAARQARSRAYAPYSRYTVGAAVLTASGKIYTGCNIENAVYPATVCAERVAIWKAISEGERDLRAIAVATRNGGSPCGICRQVMNEFAPQMLVILADMEQITAEYLVEDLLPAGFGPTHLNE